MISLDHDDGYDVIYRSNINMEATTCSNNDTNSSDLLHEVITATTGESEIVETTTSSTNVYETDESLHMYYGLHYPKSGTVVENIPSIIPHDLAPIHGLNFQQRVAQLLWRLMNSQQETPQNRNALDIGCAVGGASFELAKFFDHVDGFDFSSSFIQAAKLMQNQPETVRFRIPIEADIHQEVQVIHNDGVTESIRSKITFFTGDACQMDGMVNCGQLRTDYDGVIMSNLLCRLPDPIACLDGLSNLVHRNGLVIIVTPYSWLTEYTARDMWLGGYIDPLTNETIHSKNTLQKLMEERGFMKIHEEQMPLIIREHQRKYQYIVSEATGWKKIN